MPQAVPLVLSRKEQRAREKFLAERKTCVGGSDIKHLLGLEFGCERQLFYQKTGEPADFPQNLEDGPVNFHLRRGILLEPIAIREYQASTGRKVMCRNVFIRHPKYAFMGVHLDAVIRPTRTTRKGTLECKIPSFRAFRSYKQTNQPAAEYILQAHYNAMVSSMPWSSIDIFTADTMETLWFDQQHDPEITDALPGIVSDFWTRVTDYWAGRLTDNPFPKLDRTDKRCAKCPWRTKCQNLGETARVLLDASSDEIKEIDFEVDPDDALAVQAINVDRLSKAKNKADGLYKKEKAVLEDMIGERSAVEVPQKVKLWWKETIRNEKERAARRLSTWSLKIVPLVAPETSHGEEILEPEDEAGGADQ